MRRDHSKPKHPRSWLHFTVRDITVDGKAYVQVIGLRSDYATFDVAALLEAHGNDHAKAQRAAYVALDHFLKVRARQPVA